MSSTINQAQPPSDTRVEVFWRPGCPFCARLRKDLKRRGITARWRNIWTDAAAAGIVRDANGGNETVPTVRVGDLVLTNPDAEQVAAALPHDTTGPPARRDTPPTTTMVTATLGQTVIAASTDTVVVEGNHYFPAVDVDMRHLTRSRAKSLCPWKGIATYYTVSADGHDAKNAA